MPGVSFARPGPADGVGSLASRRAGLPRRQPFGRLCRTALDVHAMLVCPFRHHYYDPLRLPNVRRRVLRYPARSLLPVASAFRARKGSTRRSHGPFRRGALVSRSTPTGVTPHWSALSRTGDDEALSSSRAIRGSAWPALRPRWSLTRLANTPRQMLRSGTLKPSAFTHDRQATWRCFSLTGPHLSNNFRGSITHPTDLLRPASDLHFFRPTSFATGLVASLCPERTRTSWIAKTNFRGMPTRFPRLRI